jgi:hypothetical protein
MESMNDDFLDPITVELPTRGNRGKFVQHIDVPGGTNI